MAWQPNQEGLNQILGLLREATNTKVPQMQMRIHQQLESFYKIPDFGNYLTLIFAKTEAESELVRTVAGILLKNCIKASWATMPPEVHQYIKNGVIGQIADPRIGARRTVSSIITTIVSSGKIEGWPELMPLLTQLLTHADKNAVEGALSTIYLIAEDSGDALDSEALGRPLNVLIPKLIDLFNSPQETFRRYALATINQFILTMPGALLVNMERFLQGIFFLSQDPSPEVKRKVCRSFVTLLEVREDFLMPHLRNVIQYMLICTKDGDESVALEACEFWSSIADVESCRELVKEFVPVLLPILLDGMAYSEADRVMLEAEEEDELIPDKDKDIRPRFHQSKSRGEPGDPNEEDGDDDEEEGTEWNLRKCSAAGIDILAGAFQDDLLPLLLPLIRSKIEANNPWWVREGGVLAIGAIAEGCMNGMQPHLPVVIPFLIGLLDDPKPLIRSITCWSISRYSKWIVDQPVPQFLEPLLPHLLKRLLDTNKRVQEASCSAFATLEEEARELLTPYLMPILQTLVAAFAKYQAKNLLILYDAIGTLADSVGEDLNKPELVAVLMPPLIAKWHQLQDGDPGLFPLLECLNFIAMALGVGFQSFAQPVFQRCLLLIETTLVQFEAWKQNPEAMDRPNSEFIVCSLDLISGITEGLETGVESLVPNTKLFHLLFQCMKDRGSDIRQSAFAVVGDLAKHCMLHLKPCLGEYIPVLTNNLFADELSVCNNAAWALGEIAMKIGPEMKPYVPRIIERIIPILNKQNQHRNLMENVAISLGRMGFVAPEIVAPHLETFIHQWCGSLRHIRDASEKDSAFRGMCMMVKANPNGIVKHLIYVCDAIASWHSPKPDLKDMFNQILVMYKNGMGQAWTQYFATFPVPLQQILQRQYNL